MPSKKDNKIPIMMTEGNVYKLSNFRPEEIAYTITLKNSDAESNKDLTANLCHEMDTLIRYIDDESFNIAVLKVLNRYLGVSIIFPKAIIEEDI